MPAPRRAHRPLLTTLVAGALLTTGVTTAAALPAGATSTSSTMGTTSTSGNVSTVVSSETSPSPTTVPGVDDGEAEGLPWTGIVVGGGLGLVAGTVLMVLSKRRDKRD